MKRSTDTDLGLKEVFRARHSLLGDVDLRQLGESLQTVNLQLAESRFSKYQEKLK